MFYYTNITNIRGLKNWKTESLIDARFLVAECTKLENLEGLEDWDVWKVEDL